jgi:hypothetical protein
MDKSQFVIPDRAVFMVSPRDYRLSSLSGYCVNFKEGVPAQVPPHVYKEALALGARVVEGETVTPATEPEPEKPFDRDAALLDALRVIVSRNNEDDYTVNGVPKVLSVMELLPPEFEPRANSTEVARVFEILQDNIDLAED